MNSPQLVYWEKQESGTMTCGRHCLNNILQGPYLDDVELSKIAINIDGTEQALFAMKFNTYVSVYNHCRILIIYQIQEIIQYKY